MQSEFGTAEITVTEQLQEKHGVEVSPILITNVTDEVIDMERYKELLSIIDLLSSLSLEPK